MIVIIDYHVGNLMSVQNAFLKLGMDVVVSRDHDVIRQAKGIVLPGVGTFPVAMEHLKRYDLIDILKERKVDKYNQKIANINQLLLPIDSQPVNDNKF